jgi:hypothetical protein
MTMLGRRQLEGARYAVQAADETVACGATRLLRKYAKDLPGAGDAVVRCMIAARSYEARLWFLRALAAIDPQFGDHYSARLGAEYGKWILEAVDGASRWRPSELSWNPELAGPLYRSPGGAGRDADWYEYLSLVDPRWAERAATDRVVAELLGRIDPSPSDRTKRAVTMLGLLKSATAVDRIFEMLAATPDARNKTRFGMTDGEALARSAAGALARIGRPVRGLPELAKSLAPELFGDFRRDVFLALAATPTDQSLAILRSAAALPGL